MISLGGLLFSEGKQEKWIGGDGREGLGEVKGGKTGQDIIYKRRIKKNKKMSGKMVLSFLPPPILLASSVREIGRAICVLYRLVYWNRGLWTRKLWQMFLSLWCMGAAMPKLVLES